MDTKSPSKLTYIPVNQSAEFFLLTWSYWWVDSGFTLAILLSGIALRSVFLSPIRLAFEPLISILSKKLVPSVFADILISFPFPSLTHNMLSKLRFSNSNPVLKLHIEETIYFKKPPLLIICVFFLMLRCSWELGSCLFWTTQVVKS